MTIIYESEIKKSCDFNCIKCMSTGRCDNEIGICLLQQKGDVKIIKNV